MQPLLIQDPSISDIALLRPFVVQVAVAAGLTSPYDKQLRMATEEAVVNIVNHGKATAITLTAELADHRIVITIDDDGVPFDPTQQSVIDLSVPADERPLGGLGIIMMRQMTDAMSYQRVDGHNILKMFYSRGDEDGDESRYEVRGTLGENSFMEGEDSNLVPRTSKKNFVPSNNES